jgi:stage II sporulation protein D
MLRRLLPAALVAAVACALSAASGAATATATGAARPARGTFEITGAGFGHGIGMSQYGAMGYARHGWSDQAILAHYYQGTSLATVPNSTVTVLINDGAATIRGATAANGHALSAARSYGVLAAGPRLQLISDGRRSGTFTAPLKLTGASLSVAGEGRYAGSLEFFPDGSGGVLTVNAVDLEDYVRGVVAEEMPASWPQPALEAQAIAARTYVLADVPVNPDYEVYSDTRSQVYGGISGEAASTNQAESATRGQVVESSGRVIPTYFFSGSGGHTEDVQNVFLGVTPAPYLVGVADPYDDAADDPNYRWKARLSLTTAARRLAGLYRGAFQGIKVLEHGVTPRIVAASVIGTRGASTVSGATLQADLGTMSTWMTFTTVTARGSETSGTGTAAPGSTPSPAPTTTTPTVNTGGAGLGDLARARRLVSGDVFGAGRGTVTVQLRAGGHWASVGTARVTASGAYALSVFAAGTYRTLYDGVAAPPVAIR